MRIISAHRQEIWAIVYHSLIKPFLFKMDPERAHGVGETALRTPLIWSAAGMMSKSHDRRLEADFAGLKLPTPLGMAAGFDKECLVVPSLLRLGFGFVTAGTVTLAPRPGNPKPRMIRQPERYAILNALGFPGPGLEIAEARLKKFEKHKGRMFISIAGTIEDEIIECHRRLQPLAGAIELNISSPNTSGLRVFHDPGRLRALVEALAADKKAPIFVKLPPWSREDQARRDSLRLVETSVTSGADGVVVANSHPIEHEGLSSMRRGGLSGAPLTDHTARMVAEAKAVIGARGDVIACGGIFTAEDLWHMLALGASAAQLYTAFIYEGPGLPGRLNRGLLKLMERVGITSIKDIHGLPPQ